jgi:hypothetical protein
MTAFRAAQKSSGVALARVRIGAYLRERRPSARNVTSRPSSVAAAGNQLAEAF